MFDDYPFPDPRLADADGLVAIGGDFSPRRLLAAYTAGIFPWPSRHLPRAWFSPDPRMVLVPTELHLPRSLRKRIRRQPYRITFDVAFDRVLDACSRVPRPGQDGTWMTAPLIDGYRDLYRLGFAHSVEAWDDDDHLVGGVYGLSVGRMFSGESMFHVAPDASKIAFAHLVTQLRRWRFPVVDCQVYTEHLARFGAREWPRAHYLDALARALERPTRRGPWTERVDDDLFALDAASTRASATAPGPGDAAPTGDDAPASDAVAPNAAAPDAAGAAASGADDASWPSAWPEDWPEARTAAPPRADGTRRSHRAFGTS